jgi:cysteinyl-tRNA synthetase
VYDYLTVGNWTAYIYWDTLVRTLIASGYAVERVMNLTDVGHLVSDADDGEDKLEKGARREGKTAWEIAEFYTQDFLAGMEKLGLLAPEHLVKATDFITQQLDLIRVLKEKGYTYQTTDGIYFDTSKFPTYADFAQLDLAAQRAGARVEANDQKRQPWDFALWKFTELGTKRDMEWETPDDLLELPRRTNDDDKRVTRGGAAPAETALAGEDGADRVAGPVSSDLRGNSGGIGDDGSVEGDAASDPVMGFPGWHLECSAMAMSILGTTIDIHTGGIDHIPVHHTNEIAQSEAASGVKFANYWLHNNHLKIDGGKISKSLGNGYTLQDIEARGYTALDLRMFVLQGQYTNEGNFTFDNLSAAKNRLANWRDYAALRHQTHDRLHDDTKKNDEDKFVAITAANSAIREALQNNLNTPEALRVIDNAFAKLDNIPLELIHRASLVQVIEAIDELLGLQLEQTTPDITDEAKRLIIERQRARDNRDWAKSDELRDMLHAQGVTINDTAHGPVWSYSQK